MSIQIGPGWAKTAIVLGKRPGTHPDAARRAMQAHKLLHAGFVEKVLLCGGNTSDAPESEAAAMKRLLLSYHVPASKIKLEEQSRDTIGNAIYSKRLLEGTSEKRFFLITSDYHVDRALEVFQHVFGPGFDFMPVAALSYEHPLQRVLHSFLGSGLNRALHNNVSAGDDVAAEKLLKRKHPAYS